MTMKVHVKEGELLEASAGDAGGNQQPSSEQLEFYFWEGSTTIRKKYNQVVGSALMLH